MKREFQYNGKTVTYYRIDFILSPQSQRYEKQPMIRDFKKTLAYQRRTVRTKH